MITCSRCGASNPQANKFCGTCGQLLQTAASPTAEAALPANDLPAWLSEVGVPDEAPAASQTPDWLAQLQQDPQPAPPPADELPAWLRAEVEAQASAPAPARSNDVPDWLREVEAETPAALAAPSSAAGGAVDELPPWLRDDAASAGQFTPPAAPSSAAGGSELPDWLREVEAETPAVAAAPSSAGGAVDELPPWLRDDAAPVSQPAAAASVPNELPDWLREVEAETPVALAAPSSAAGGAVDELPPWLRDDAAPVSQPAAAASVPNELPDWLREVEAETPAALAAPSSAAGGAVDELPPWLRDDAAPVSQPAAAASVPNELPDWLREVEAETPGASTLDDAAPAWNVSQASAQPDVMQFGGSGSATTQPLDLPLPDWSSEFGAPVAQDMSQETQELPVWLQESPSGGEALDTPDWLREASPVPTAQTQPLAGSEPAHIELPAAQELPAWLADDTAPPDRTPPSAATTQAMPSWLLDQPETTSQPSAASAAEDDLPAWLQSVDEPAPAPTTEGLPAWLALPDEPAMDAGTARVYETSTNEGLPAWLSEDAPAADAGTARVYETSTNEGLPAWLSEDAPATDAGAARVYETSASSAPSSAETIQLPAWLADAEQSTPTTSPAASAGQPSDADLPPWLSGIAAEEPAPATTNAPSALPSWLDEPEQPAPQQTTAPQSEFLGGLDLPAWLRSEQEAEPATPTVGEAAPSWLQRSAVDNDEPMPSVAAPIASPAPRIVRTPERVAAMQMLEQIVASPAPEPMPQPVARRRSRLMPVLLTLAVLLIVGGILFVLLSPRLGLNFGAAPLAVPAASTAVQTIAALPAGKPVLLAYEWDAQRLAELGALEDAVVGQLAQRTDVPLILMSTDPQGALLAGERTTQLLAIKDGFHDQYSLGVVNLGFKAGGPIALQRFADDATFGDLFAQDAGGYDLRGEPVAMQSMCGGPTAASCAWDDVGMLVILADEAEDVRGWFEQVRSAHPDLPTLLLTPAEIGPQVQPYAVTANTSALSGLVFAEAYNQARGIQDERLGRQVDAAAVGGATFALLVLVGAVPAYITGRRERQDDQDDLWRR